MARSLRIAAGASQALHAKQGRKAQFGSVEERDKYLENEIRQLKDSLATTQGVRQQVVQQAAGLASEANDLSSVSAPPLLPPLLLPRYRYQRSSIF